MGVANLPVLFLKFVFSHFSFINGVGVVSLLDVNITENGSLVFLTLQLNLPFVKLYEGGHPGWF